MYFDRAINRIRNETMPKMITLENPADWTVADMTVGTTQSGAMKLSAVNACVEVITNSISKLPVFMMDKNTKQRVNHSLLSLLADRPNEAMTPSTYKKLIETNRLLKGNGYALISRNSRTAKPEQLIPINSQFIAPFIDNSGRLWYIFVHPKTGEIRKLNNFDILHYKAYSEDGINGISVLTRASEIVDVAKAAQIYENKLYTQNARPSGILRVNDKLQPEAKAKVKEEWERIHKGSDNSFKIAVLDLGLEYQQISMSNKDTQFVESKAISIEDIARFFGVPLYKINSGKQSYSSNEQNGIEYVVNTLHPIVCQYEEEDTYKLLFDADKKKGLEIRRNMMAELRGDSASRGTWYKTMREVGAFSPDDILALEDMPSVPGGDTRYASLNYIPLELFKELSVNRNGGEK
ncbi:MAG: phage portal protein [Eubacteriaceae bacterium]